MDLLKHAITVKGKVLPGDVLKVGSFLNQQIDVRLLAEMAKDIFARFCNCAVTKVLTVESSGIALACLTAQFFNCNAVFAKKSKSNNIEGEILSAECYSYTHKTANVLLVPREYIAPDDKVLFVDDFLAKGEALRAAVKLVKEAGATFVGAAIAIEKGFQGGGDALRKEGVDVYSLAIIDSMKPGEIVFRN